MAAVRARADRMIEMECIVVGESMLLVGYVNALPSRSLLRYLRLKTNFGREFAEVQSQKTVL